jgi:hypothetical protein
VDRRTTASQKATHLIDPRATCTAGFVSRIGPPGVPGGISLDIDQSANTCSTNLPVMCTLQLVSMTQAMYCAADSILAADRLDDYHTHVRTGRTPKGKIGPALDTPEISLGSASVIVEKQLVAQPPSRLVGLVGRV